MERSHFVKSIFAMSALGTLSSFRSFTDLLAVQSKRMPVLFTSHGNPMDIPLSRDERPFWKALFDLGVELKTNYEVKAAVVISAHWCTKGTFINVNKEQKQIYDYYGFPPHYYDPKYTAFGYPELAKEIAATVKNIAPSTDWGLDHGAWPMLMHLFPEGDVPVFQMSLDYYAAPSYHFELAKELAKLREKGVLIIGSGSLIHNLQLAISKMRANDMTPYGWELEYDAWLKTQLETRNVNAFLNYENSHKLGKLAAPTPDHFVPVLYALGLMNKEDDLHFFYESLPSLPAFSERSFILKSRVG